LQQSAENKQRKSNHIVCTTLLEIEQHVER